jgi:hypothetical protein
LPCAAAHRIGNIDMQQLLCDRRREHAPPKARAVEITGVATADIATTDDKFSLLGLQQRKHLRKLRFVVLQISIHHRYERR